MQVYCLAKTCRPQYAVLFVRRARRTALYCTWVKQGMCTGYQLGYQSGWHAAHVQGEVVSNHDELMCNFFAQADALATGKTPVELRAENVPDSLIPHKTFTGNRPSTSLLLPELTAFTTGQILSLYENRIAVQARAAAQGRTCAVQAEVQVRCFLNCGLHRHQHIRRCILLHDTLADRRIMQFVDRAGCACDVLWRLAAAGLHLGHQLV